MLASKSASVIANVAVTKALATKEAPGDKGGGGAGGGGDAGGLGGGGEGVGGGGDGRLLAPIDSNTWASVSAVPSQNWKPADSHGGVGPL